MSEEVIPLRIYIDDDQRRRLLAGEVTAVGIDTIEVVDQRIQIASAWLGLVAWARH